MSIKNFVNVYIQGSTSNIRNGEIELDVTVPDPTDGTICAHASEHVAMSYGDWVRISIDPFIIGYLEDMYELTIGTLNKGPEEAGMSQLEWDEQRERMAKLWTFIQEMKVTEV